MATAAKERPKGDEPDFTDEDIEIVDEVWDRIDRSNVPPPPPTVDASKTTVNSGTAR